MRCNADCLPERGERILCRLNTTTCFKVYRSLKSFGRFAWANTESDRLNKRRQKMILDALNIYFVCLQKYKNLCETDSFFPHNFCTFAPSLAKGMPCKSATVPAAVSPRKACQTSHCTAHLYGKATGSDKSEDLPDKEFNCKPSGTRATLSAAISIASCDGFAKFVQCVIINKLCVKIYYLSFRLSRQR